MNKLLLILLVVVLSGCSSPDRVEVGVELLCTEEKRTETDNALDYENIACYENLTPSGIRAIQFLSNGYELKMTDDYYGENYYDYDVTPEWIYIKNNDDDILEKINRISGEAQTLRNFRNCRSKCELSPGAFSTVMKEYESKKEVREEKLKEWESRIEEEVEEEVEEPDLVRENRKF